MGRLLHFGEARRGLGRAGALPNPLLAVPNVTAHPSTASVPTSYSVSKKTGLLQLISHAFTNSQSSLLFFAQRYPIQFSIDNDKFLIGLEPAVRFP